jgi:hypothetical protein
VLEPPTRPDARRGSLRSALPSGLWLGAALAVGLLGIAIVLRVQDRSGSVPATSTFAAAAITMSVVAIVTVAGAARSIGAPWRAAITLAGGFAAITLAKFGMGPLALYRGNEVHVIQNLGGGGSGDLIVVIAIGVGLFYVAAIWLLAVVFRPAPPPDGPSVKALVTLVVVALAAVIVTGFVTSAAPDYIAFATTGVQASGIAVALFVAAGLVSAAFRDTAARSKALGQATMYLTIAWVAIAFLLVFQILWVVFLLAIVAIWPLKTVTPK